MSFPHPRTILKRLGLRPKKSLGQHFLVHPQPAQRLVHALDPPAGAVIVEIGGGLGALSLCLAERGSKLVVLEADPVLAVFLEKELFLDHPQVRVLCQDVLTFDFLDLVRETGVPLQVTGNLPYHITSPLLFKLMDHKAAIRQAVVMVQQEVGERLLAPPGTKAYGILSVLVRYHFAVERLFSVGPKHFYPPPQVRSMVLRLVPRPFDPMALDEGLLARVVKGAFGKRRKTLKNTLVAQAAAFGCSHEEMRRALEELGINPQQRGETLSVTQFVRLSNRLAQASGREP